MNRTRSRRRDGGFDAAEGVEGAEGLVLGAEGEAHEGLEAGGVDVGHGVFGEAAEHDVEHGGLGDGQGGGMLHVAGVDEGGEVLELGEGLEEVAFQIGHGTDHGDGGGGLKLGVETHQGGDAVVLVCAWGREVVLAWVRV